MSVVKQVDLQCDDCGEWLIALTDTVKDAREAAHEALWIHQDGRDICTRCQPDETFTRNVERSLGLRR